MFKLFFSAIFLTISLFGALPSEDRIKKDVFNEINNLGWKVKEFKFLKKVLGD